MADGIKSYEDWTPPKFLQGEELDVERVKQEFFNRERDNLKYRRRNKALSDQLEELTEGADDEREDDNDGEEPKAKAKKDSSKKGEGQGPSLNEIRLEIALDKGLTRSQARRLQGETREELEADAQVYMEEHGILQEEPKDGDGEGQQSQKPPMRAPKRGEVKSGSERQGGDSEPSFYDPEKFLEQV